MEWLRQNAFLAAWLAPVVALVVFLFENKKTQFANVDWTRALVRFAFLVALAMEFVPGIDLARRIAANTILFTTLGWIMMDRVR